MSDVASGRESLDAMVAGLDLHVPPAALTFRYDSRSADARAAADVAEASASTRWRLRGRYRNKSSGFGLIGDRGAHMKISNRLQSHRKRDRYVRPLLLIAGFLGVTMQFSHAAT